MARSTRVTEADTPCRLRATNRNVQDRRLYAGGTLTVYEPLQRTVAGFRPRQKIGVAFIVQDDAPGAEYRITMVPPVADNVEDDMRNDAVVHDRVPW